MVEYYAISCGQCQAKFQLCSINIKQYDDDEYVDENAYYNGVRDGYGDFHGHDNDHNHITHDHEGDNKDEE